MDREHLKDIMRKLKITVHHESDSGWFTCSCPFAKWLHGSKTDNRPSFFVRADIKKKSGFNCYSCHKSGNIIQLIRALSHYRKREYPGLDIEAQIAEVRAGISFEYDTIVDDEPEPIEESAFEGMFVPAWRSKRARRYLREERMISETTAELLGLLYDRDEQRILFPVRGRRQELYGFTGRTILSESQWPNERYAKIRDYAGLAKKKLLLGSHLVDTSKPMFAVEGLFAFAAMYEEACDRLGNPVGTMGSTMSPEQATMFIEWGQPVYDFYDNDKAGRRGFLGYKDAEGEFRQGAAHKLCGELPVFIPEWPDSRTDPDELFFRDVKRMKKNASLFVDRMPERKGRGRWNQ